MTNDYKAAIEGMEHAKETGLRLIYAVEIDTILHALRLAQKVSEPSEEMEAAGVAACNLGKGSLRIFEAMIAQATKEKEDDQ